jgi:hypothetical protein
MEHGGFSNRLFFEHIFQSREEIPSIGENVTASISRILRRALHEQDAAELRAATYAGLPYGEPEFVEQLE